jgi:hypothetical protein
MLSFARRVSTITMKNTQEVRQTDGIYSFHVYKDDAKNTEKRIMYFCQKSRDNVSLCKLDLNHDYLRKHVSISLFYSNNMNNNKFDQ